jgi:uncharacterized protein (TIGR00299 family) protein
MKILLFDPFSGAAGDMVTGALLDCGADRGLVLSAMESVVGRPTITRVTRGGIAALRVETHAGPSRRTLGEVLAILDRADAPDAAKSVAKSVFSRLHRAEALVHGDERVHFHEVGADDAIADVVGACTALVSLGVDGVAVRPVRLGSGSGSGDHGTISYPSPATVAILKEAGIPVRLSDTGRELCTPTGASLLAEFATIPHAAVPDAAIEAVGYGAGTRDPGDAPNVLRAMLLTASGGRAPDDRVDVLETNVDDVTAEVLAYTLQTLMDAGARDASAVPLLMKKGRMGYLVRVIAAPADSHRLGRLMASELGTLGVRMVSSVHRIRLRRTFLPVEVTIGTRSFSLDVKVGWDAGEAVSLKAEYEQAREIAGTAGVPLREVTRKAEEAGWRLLREPGEGR